MPPKPRPRPSASTSYSSSSSSRPQSNANSNSSSNSLSDDDIPTIIPVSMEAPSIYTDNHSGAALKRIYPGYKPRTGRPVDLSKRFTPWDGTLPATIITASGTNAEKIKDWLHRSSHRPVIKTPFAVGYEDSEPPPPAYPHAYPERLSHNESRYRRILGPDDAFNPLLGTIVIPRHHDDADMLLLLSTTDNNAAPPKGPEALLARFLVCSRTVLCHIPALRGQASHHSGFVDAQRIGLPDGTQRVFGLFLFKLPKLDLTALWLIITILHHRWPTAWSDMDIPLDTLFETAKLIHILEIPGNSEALLSIRTRLSRTLDRHAQTHYPPSDTPSVAKWIYTAKTFGIETNFASLWAHLIVSTWRFHSDSVAVDRYLPPQQLPSGRYKYGNWYWVSDLGPALMKTLLADRTKFLHGMLHLWSWFRCKYRLPSQATGGFTAVLAATTSYDGSALDLRDHIISYVDRILEHQKFLALITPGDKELQPNIMADITGIKEDLEALFQQVDSRDVFGDPQKVGVAEYLLNEATPPLRPPIQTPLELDPVAGLNNTIFTYQSGHGNNLVYWRNKAPGKPPKIVIGSRGMMERVIILLCILYVEFVCTFSTVSKYTMLEYRTSLYALLFVWWFSSTLKESYNREMERQTRIRIQELMEEQELDDKARVFAWMDEMDDEAHRVNLRPRGTPAKVGQTWTRLTPLEKPPENIYLATEREMEVKKFREERAKRWRKEGRNRHGWLPGEIIKKEEEVFGYGLRD